MATLVTLPSIDAQVEFPESLDEVSTRLGHAISHGAALEIQSRDDGSRILVNLAQVNFLTVGDGANPIRTASAYTATLKSILA
jgi:hypothetical protein